jgi:hypothetical protein
MNVTSRRLLSVRFGSGSAGSGDAMKPPIKSLSGLKPGAAQNQSQTYARPTPKVSRRKTAKVLTAEERAAFLASRPDLASKS